SADGTVARGADRSGGVGVIAILGLEAVEPAMAFGRAVKAGGADIARIAVARRAAGVVAATRVAGAAPGAIGRGSALWRLQRLAIVSVGADVAAPGDLEGVVGMQTAVV